MALGWNLLIWLIILIVVFLIARAFRIRTWSAFILAVLISGLYLAWFTPQSQIMTATGGWIGLYAVILGLSTILILIYIIQKAVTDKAPVGETTTWEFWKTTESA